MKKRISVLLIVCLLFTFACGCSDEKPQESNKVEVLDLTPEEIEAKMAEMNIYPLYDDMYVHFIDVGQGDCTFIQLANGQTMLIDAGNPGDGSKIIEYIKNIFEYSDIDYVVATHPHDDHIGGMAEVIDRFNIGAMYMPKVGHTSYTYENLLDTIDKNDIPLYDAKAGTNILTSGPITIDILAPFDKEYENLNNYSAVVRLSYGETVFLFMGDAEVQVEYDLLEKDIDADVIKVGHHGSDTASTEYFISEVTPEVAVISCGADNRYGHPHNTALSILNDYGADIYRTDEVGTIVVTADMHKNITVDKKASEIKENAPPIKTEQEIIVYKTNYGECYHDGSCSYLSKSKIEMTLSQVVNEWLRACSRCSRYIG